MQLSKVSYRSTNNIINERREKVMVLLTKGLKGYQIANELQVDPATVSRDIHYLSQESTNNLKSIVKETLPFLYQTSIEGIRSVLNECWNIYQNERESINYPLRLSCLKLIKESHESLFKLVTEAPTIAHLEELEERLRRIEVEKHKKENS